tara:strand:- start:2563 stop:3141 length:579 start_codon:yes stop_codon:yes gene_type:complete
MINMTAAIAVMLASTPVNYEPTYQNLIFEAKYNCVNANPAKVEDKILEDLVEIEKKYDVPSSLRGMILAASCMESGHNPKAKGDYRVIKNKKLPMAIGILQQWPWYEKTYNINRTNHIQAADAWMKHIHKKVHMVKRTCGFKGDRKRWIAGWVTAIRYPKPEGRCFEKPRHLRILNKWHRKIKKSLAKGGGC